MAVLLVLAYVNSRGVRWGANVQNGFTLLKAGSLLALVAAALITGRGTIENLFPLAPEQMELDLFGAVGFAMISVLFAYDGWHFVGFMAGEMRDPARNVPRSIFSGIVIMIALYAAVNLAYFFALGHAAIAASDRVASDAMSAMIGPAGASLIALAILCSTFGANAANMLAGPRVLFAMARDGLVFGKFAEIHPRFASPANAIWLLAIWASILTLTGGYEHLITMAMFANWILFTMVAYSVVVLRRRHPEWPRPYRVPLYPLPVVVFVLVAAAFVVNTLVGSTRSSLLGLGIQAVGVLFYLLRSRPLPP
jgi:APA family basic amino acid/polyamine antiporter